MKDLRPVTWGQFKTGFLILLIFLFGFAIYSIGYNDGQEDTFLANDYLIQQEAEPCHQEEVCTAPAISTITPSNCFCTEYQGDCPIPEFTSCHP